jgi:hypothetical protein
MGEEIKWDKEGRQREEKQGRGEKAGSKDKENKEVI